MLEIESKPISEVQKPPDEVISKIAELYSSDMNKVYSKEAEEERNKEWDSVAKEFSDYSGIIKELGKVIIEVNKKKNESPDITKYGQLFLSRMVQGPGKDLLVDVWCYRTQSTNLNEIMFPGSQVAKKMIEEMGIVETNLCCKTPKKITREGVISLILQGKPKLKSTPQPK